MGFRVLTARLQRKLGLFTNVGRRQRSMSGDVLTLVRYQVGQLSVMTEHETALKAIRDLNTHKMDRHKAILLMKAIARAALEACKALEAEK